MNRTLSALIFLISTSCFSQENLKGEFCTYPASEADVTCIMFKENNRFEFRVSGCLGISSIGTGDFVLNKNVLKLTFDKKEQPTRNKIRINEVKSDSKENIEFEFNVVDEYGLPLYVWVIESPGEKRFEIYKENNKIVVEKKGLKMRYKAQFIGYESAEFELEHNSSKVIDIQMFPAQPHVISEKVLEWKLTELNSDEFKTDANMWYSFRKVIN